MSAGCGGSSFGATAWNAFRHERTVPDLAPIDPDGIHAVSAEGLREHGPAGAVRRAAPSFLGTRQHANRRTVPFDLPRTKGPS